MTLVALSSCDSLGTDAPTIGGRYTGVDTDGDAIVVTIPAGTESDSGDSFDFTYATGSRTQRVSPTYRYPQISWNIFVASLRCDVSADGDTLDCIVTTPGENEVDTFEFMVTRPSP